MKRIIALITSILVFTSSVAWAGKTFVVDVFKGLERNPGPEYIADGAFTKFDNLYIDNKHLLTIKGRVKLNATADTNTTKNMVCYYENAAGTTKKYVVQESTVLVSYDTDWTNRTELNTGLTNQYHSCKQLGDTLYITSDTDGLYKWTGSGAATAISGVSAPSSVNFAASSTVGGKTPGTPIIVAASLVTDSTCATTPSTSATGCICLAAAGSNSCDSEDVGGENVTSDDGTLEAAGDSTTYSYKVTKWSSLWGIESEASSADTATLTGDTNFTWNATNCVACDTQSAYNDYGHSCCSGINYTTSGRQTSTTGTLAAAPSAPFDGYCIYTTVANGTDYFKLGCVVGGGTTYTDGKPDVALNGPLDTTIDTITPPSYKYIEEYKGVLFLGQGTDIYFTRLPVQVTTSADTYWLNTDKLTTGSKEALTGLKSTSNSLLMFTPNRTLELTGFGVSSFRLKTLYDGIGAISHDTIESTNAGDIIFFSGTRGVYKLKVGQPTTDSAIGSILDTNRAQLEHVSSPMMDSVFQGTDSQIVLSTSDYASSHAYYDQDNGLYFLFIGTHAFIYDEANAAWSHIPGTKMGASVYRKSPGSAGQGLVVDTLGFAYDNFKSYSMGGPGSGTLTGAPTSGGNTSLTDSGASFYTTGSGLAGVWVAKVDSSLGIEYRQITSNTSTVLTVGTAWTSNPTTSDTYYIGYIIPDFTTKMYSLAKPPASSVIQSVSFLHNKSDATQTMYTWLSYKTDAISSTTSVNSINLASYFIDKITALAGQGNWLQFNGRTYISNTSDTINPPLDIISYSVFGLGVEEE